MTRCKGASISGLGTMQHEPTLFVTAADVSGDIHAAKLIRALSGRLPGARFVGVGGEHMAEAGCELLDRTTGRATMLTHSVGHILYYHRLIRRVAKEMAEQRPAVHIPVDSPAMNWHLAKAARRRDIPVMYYICPQVWAWAPWRVRKLRRLTDVVACILPFEPCYLRPRGVNAHYVGHPLFDELDAPDPPDLDDPARTGRWRIALLPGSRAGEISDHVPPLVAVYDHLRRKYPQAEFAFTAVGPEAADRIRAAAGRDDLPMEVSRTPEVLKRSHFAVVVSGTVTLEVAHFGVPMVVFYRAGRVAYHLLGRWLIRTKYLSLVNILAGKELVPELMPWFGDVGELIGTVDAMLAHPGRLERIRQALLELVRPLKATEGTSADQAAELVVKTMATGQA